MENIQKLLKRRGYLTRQLLRFREMLPGSFIERKITCGKPNCTCKVNNLPHKAYQLTYRQDNKTITQMIPADMVSTVKKQVMLQKRCKQIIKEIQDINIKILIQILKERKKER